ncbi:MAG: Unknown protein [uncultured Sulfurovum sp.]|uniref:LysM domain-containing protein n=1 Tax=uncultured Sulfurovum sp. TaxID=269237 RepID=A0A6S6S9D3_9BACT|nr:MAG: Unknown protein [uncultured Sulfurovum sp.]
MKKRLLKLTLGASLLMGSTLLNARKMDSNIVHGIPWVETRLSYAMTVTELAQKYYGNIAEVNEIMKLNKNISKPSMLLQKDMIVSIPMIHSFTEQPERLGWIR